MYLKMFGFTEKPFHITPDPRFIFLSKIHKEAFAHLLYGIQQRVGFMSLAGEIGTGKTTVLRTLLGQLEDAEYRVALIFNPCLTALELLQTILREFAVQFDPERENLVELHDALNRFLLQQREAGKTVVLVIDEAQNLDPKVLEQLRLLSNLETETEKLIQMVLVGQPELHETLQRQDLRQLRQRLVVNYQLQPMDADDTQRYVLHRVRIAGNQDRDVFSSQALKQIYKYTQGTPRLINVLCDRALLVAYSHDSRLVSKRDIQTAHKELRQQGLSRLFKFQTAWILLPITILLVFVFNFSLLPDSATMPDTNLQVATTVQPSVLKTEKPVSTAEAVSNERIAELTSKINDLSIEDSGKQALMAIGEAWQQPLSELLPLVKNRQNMKQVLRQSGFDLVEFQGDFENLLRLDAPVILLINFPNSIGVRFLSIQSYRDGQLLVSPALTESGWLPVNELKQFWFGKALLPYINFQTIPLISQKGQRGRHVTAVQRLLAQLPDVEMAISDTYDRQTIDVVTRFQRRMELAPDGLVGAHTLYWLYRQTGYQIPRLNAGGGS